MPFGIISFYLLISFNTAVTALDKVLTKYYGAAIKPEFRRMFMKFQKGKYFIILNSLNAKMAII